jgi:glycosyltransferase involved in cell wall biosynthesis
MRILIDATSITTRKAGVGVYASNLIEEMASLLREGDELFVLAQDDDPEMDFRRQARVKMLLVPAGVFRHLPLRFVLEQAILPVLLAWHRVEVLHSLHYSFPLVRFGTRQVVTIHDMTSFTMPELLRRLNAIYYRVFARAAVRRADAIIFVSESTRRDCIRILGTAGRSSRVIYLGKSAAFRPDLGQDLCVEARERYGIGAEYVLYIGTIEPRKNLSNLVAAFAALSGKYPSLLLAIAGMKGWMFEGLFKQVAALGLGSRVIFAGYVAEEDKPYLIAGAKAFAYPSLYEGFGIPVLEALACGTPTVTSNLSSIPEVAGDAALLVDPCDAGQISEALDRILSEEALRDSLRAASLEQAAKFTWSKTAESTLQSYRDAWMRRKEPSEG